MFHTPPHKAGEGSCLSEPLPETADPRLVASLIQAVIANAAKTEAALAELGKHVAGERLKAISLAQQGNGALLYWLRTIHINVPQEQSQ
jgi:hypothetical protein